MSKGARYEVRLGEDVSKWSHPERWEIWKVWDNGNEFSVAIIDTNGADHLDEHSIAVDLCDALNRNISNE